MKRRASIAAAIVLAAFAYLMITVAPAAAQPATKQPAAIVTVSVESDPAGAQVFVDGKSVCTAPCDLKTLKPGTKYTIEIKKSGYKTRTMKKSWADPGKYVLQITLEQNVKQPPVAAPVPDEPAAEPVVLTVFSEPEDADVYVNLEKRCTSPCKIKDLATGVDYSIEIRLKDHKKAVFARNWEKGGAYTIQAALEPVDENATGDGGIKQPPGDIKPVPAQPGMNICEKKAVTDMWGTEAAARNFTVGWLAGSKEYITDGDLQSGLISGYGGWGETGDGATLDVQTALGEASRSAGGIPALYIDLAKVYSLDRFNVARPPQDPSEGLGGLPTMMMSLWGSADAKEWKQIGDYFAIPPGQQKEIKLAGKPVSLRYIRVNINSLGMYKTGRKTQSQMGISEVECFSAAVKKK